MQPHEDAQFVASVNRRDCASPTGTDALDRTQGDAAREPEALYFASVAACKAVSDVEKLLEGWNRLLDRFPEGDWAKKIEFIRK